MARERVRKFREVTIKVEDAKLQEIIRANAGKSSIELIIADGVEYGIFQEFSTAPGGQPRKSGKGLTQRGHPSLVPAFQKVQFGIPPAIGRAIEAGISPFDLMRKFAFDIMNLWARDVNVDTGNYKNSIHVEEQ